MYTTIQRLIKSQIGEIATFKALGFSNIQIESHYASFGLIVGVLGTIVGIIVAPLVSWFVLNSQRKMFSLPSWQISYNFFCPVGNDYHSFNLCILSLLCS